MQNERLTIKSWAEEDRPREKMIEKGALALSDAELIGILIGSGTREETAIDLAKTLLKNSNNDLNLLGKLTIQDFCKLKGIGQARAVTIAAALELGRRRKETEKQKEIKITESPDIYEMFAPILADLPYEEFWMLYLNRSHGVIEKVKISQGGIDRTIADVKLIVKLAVDRLASSAVAVHNHPSGNLQPGKEDINITSRIKTALQYFDISLIDHLIVTDHGYYSFADEGIL